ncbi:discoidin domain-containing protein [Marinobacter shengliensis]|uniref:discoidin domain-containing protein n=1 Tax=Marinobacter shengliensis TaxID=1389223 RepID=UPI001E508E1F|nr:discoidin domain-containing protein [Marinobacter shengliensis]MCD1628444.1 discoidin domain-containing protein [Marinobacter shengliensis]
MAYKFWRVLCHTNGGDLTWSVDLQEVVFLNGTTVLSTGGVAFADSSFDATTTPDKAFDANTGTSWLTDAGLPCHIGYEHSTDVIVTSVKLQAPYASRAPNEFEIQYSSDGLTWTSTLEGRITSTGWTANEIREFAVTHFDLAGNATNSLGAAVEKVNVFDWNTGQLLRAIVPATNGDWSTTLFSNNQYGVTYLSAGYYPLTHGPYQPA